MDTGSGGVPCREQPYNDPKNPKILTFYPTMEEFADFEKYIDYMESRNAHLGGIAKVVPPAGWVANKAGYPNLGDKVIDAPIHQNVKQTPNRGAYEVRNTEAESMTLDELRRFAEENNMVYSFAEEMDEIERNFWKQLAINPPIYGADSSGTLFDEDVAAWNVSNLPSILRTINDVYGIAIQGVNTPYLYFGMWRAFFGWHTEDMDLYSINYIHQGAAKFWYGLAPHNGRRLERLAASLFPEAFKQCNAFLRHKTSMISHSVLKSSGIPFNRIMQQEGEFIVTFPHAYHAGFNCGLNVAESTNFATQRWIDYGKYASICSCQEDNVKIDMGIFIRKYRPDEIEAWDNGTERGRHPEDERSSKRPPTSGPWATQSRKGFRPKSKISRPKMHHDAKYSTSDGQDAPNRQLAWNGHKRAMSESSESGFSSSSSLPVFGKRSCSGLAPRGDRLDHVLYRAPDASNDYQIPPALPLCPRAAGDFCETVSERVCRGGRRHQTPESSSSSSSSSTPPRASAPTSKPKVDLVATPRSRGEETALDLRKPVPFHPWRPTLPPASDEPPRGHDKEVTLMAVDRHSW